jgi:excisionase family DNA binding protein
MAKKVELRVISDFYDVAETAIYIKVAKGTVYQMIHKKKMTKIPVRYQGRKPIFFIEELKQWMLQRTASV